MAQDFLFLSGRISARASQFLSDGQLSRMITASSSENAFRVFLETEFAEKITNQVPSSEFSSVLEKGLLQAKHFVMEGTDAHPVFKAIWHEFDVSNLRKAFRDSQEGKSIPEEFSEQTGYSCFGDILPQDMKKIVIDHKTELLPVIYQKGFEKALAQFKKDQSFAAFDFIITQAHMCFLESVSKKHGGKFLAQYFNFQKDQNNLKLALKNIVLKEDIHLAFFGPVGEFKSKKIYETKTLDGFFDLLRYSDFWRKIGEDLLEWKQANEAENDDEVLLWFERFTNAQEMSFLKNASRDAQDGIEMAFSYFLMRMRDAQILRFIMYAKMYGMTPEKISETIKYF